MDAQKSGERRLFSPSVSSSVPIAPGYAGGIRPIPTQRETIVWCATGDLPDADEPVLVTLDGSDEPTWPGFHDGDCWRDACSGREFGGEVVSWTPMPAGFNPRAGVGIACQSVIDQLEAIGQQRLPL